MRMIDTVVLSVPYEGYKIQSPELFNPVFRPINPNSINAKSSFLRDNKGHITYRQNPPKHYRESGLVYPNLRIEERLSFVSNAYSCDLNIAFSCPKLIRGHSFSEVTDADLPVIVAILAKRLADMGIEVSSNTLRYAKVHTLHYCTNMLFPTEGLARIFLGRIYKTSFGKIFENNKRTYANDGNTVRFHTSIFELVFYLKYYDALEKGTRAVDKATTKQEKVIVKRLYKNGSIPPVIRMEVRFIKTRSVTSHLRTALGQNKTYWNFHEVFNTTTSIEVQIYYWQKILSNPLNYTILSQGSDADLCRKVLIDFQMDKLKEILEGVGMYFMLNTLGVKPIKEMITTMHNRQNYYRKAQQIAEFARQYAAPNEEIIQLVTRAIRNSNRS